MKLKELTTEDREKYQLFVTTNGSFLQDWEWGDFLETQGRRIRRFGLFDNDQLVMSAQGYTNTVLGKSYFFAPYGPVAKNLQNLDEFCLGLKKIIPGLIFFRFEPTQDVSFNSKSIAKTVDIEPHKTSIVDLTQSEEKLLERMHEKTRYNIRLSQKNGLEIKINDQSNPGSLIIKSAKRAGIRSYENKYFSNLTNFLKNNRLQAKIYSIWHGSDKLAEAVIVFHEPTKTATYLFGGSSILKRNLMPTYLLHWQIMVDAKKAGYLKYDFYGIEDDPKHPWYGFSFFKMKFGGETVRYSGTWDYIYQPAWYNIYIILRKLNRAIR